MGAKGLVIRCTIVTSIVKRDDFGSLPCACHILFYSISILMLPISDNGFRFIDCFCVSSNFLSHDRIIWSHDYPNLV